MIGLLRRNPSGVVAAVGVVISVVVALQLYATTAAERQAKVDDDADRAVRLVDDELRRYLDPTRLLAAALRADPQLDLDTYAALVAATDPAVRYPAANGFAIVTRVPVDELDAFVSTARERGMPDFEVRPPVEPGRTDPVRPITLIAPLDANRSAIGFDITATAAAYEAATRAIALGQPVATAPVTLVQETGEQAGFVVYRPFGLDPVLPPAAGDDAIGWSSAVFRGEDFLDGVFENSGLDVLVEVTDVDVPADAEPGPRIGGWPAGTVLDRDAAEVRSLEVYDRTWEIAVAEAADEPSAVWRGATISLLLGLLVTSLVSALVHSQRQSEARAVRLADGLTAELRASEQELELANDDLERRNDELLRFTYVASHDLQEPLRMVTSFLGLLEEHLGDDLDDDASTYLGFAVDGAGRMADLIRDLLVLSRVERQAARREQVDVDLLVRSTLASLAPLLEEEGGEVEVRRTDTVVGDPTQLGQLLQNLVGNAVKFHRPGRPPHIVVDARMQGETWVLTVADDGIGIEPEYRERVLEAFRRLHTRADFEGTGIGLAICARVAEAHGGTINVDGNDEGGTTIEVRLPIATPTRPE